jgi:hypothetical protein
VLASYQEDPVIRTLPRNRSYDKSARRVSDKSHYVKRMAHDGGVRRRSAQTNRRRTHPSSNGTFISGCERFSENSQDPSTRRYRSWSMLARYMARFPSAKVHGINRYHCARAVSPST